jgi:sporulation protein YlmC with PRC-barrel domain
MKIAMDELPGRRVLDINGRVLGKMGQLVVETDSWAIDAFRLRLRRLAARDLGVPWSIFRIPTVEVPTGLVMAASDEIILRASLEEIAPLAQEAQPATRSPQPAQQPATALS